MSRFSLDPPDTDRYEDRPLDASELPADGEPYPDPRERVLSRSGDERPDPAALAELAILSACEAIEAELVKVEDLTRGYELWNCTRRLWRRIDALNAAVGTKVDEVQA